MRISIINGPNLNLLGKREPEIYGKQSFEEYFEELQRKHPVIKLTYFQSNREGEIIDHLHKVGYNATGIILNAAAYTHTSVAIADAVAAISSPVIEVHISNVYARESFRHHSYLSPYCIGIIAGLGLAGYEVGVQYFVNQAKQR